MKRFKKKLMTREIYNNGVDKTDPKKFNSEKNLIKRQAMRSKLAGCMKDVERVIKMLNILTNNMGEAYIVGEAHDTQIDALIKLGEGVKDYLWEYRNYLPLAPKEYDEMKRAFNDARGVWNDYQGSSEATKKSFESVLDKPSPASMKRNVINSTLSFLTKAQRKLGEVDRRENPQFNENEVTTSNDQGVLPFDVDNTTLYEIPKSQSDIDNMVKAIKDVAQLILGNNQIIEKNQLERANNLVKEMENIHQTYSHILIPVEHEYNPYYRQLNTLYQELSKIAEPANPSKDSDKNLP